MKRGEQVEVQQSESEAMLPDAEFYFNILQDYFESVSHDRLVKSANGLAVVQKTYTNYPDWNHRYTVMENMRSMAKSVLLNNGFEGDSVSDVIEVMMNHCLQVDKQRDLINMQLKEYGNVASEPFQINSFTDNTVFFHEHQPVSFGDAIAASREPLLTYSVRSSSSAYYNSVELQREVEAIGSLDHVLAGYEDYKTGDYVFVGKAADVIFRARALGTLQDGDDMTKDSVYTLPMGTDAGHKIFDSLSAKLVKRGYRFGIIGADKVRDLVERPESLDIDVVHPGEREGNVLRLQDRKPRVTSAIQLDLFGSEDFITHEEDEHPVAVNVFPGEVVSNEHINDFDPTQLTMRHLDDGEQCYVERRYTENGYFSFVGGDHIESDADVAYIFRSLEDKSIENSFICMVKDGNPTVIHLGIGDATSVMAPIQDALLAYKALEPDKIWFIHNHPSGNLKVSREDYRLQERMEKIFGAACQPGIIINTTSGKFMAYTSSYDLDGAHYIRDGKAGNKAVRTFSFDRNVFEKGWDPFEAFNGSSYRDVAKFVSSHRLGEREKLSLLVMNNNGNITGNIFLPWTNIKDVCSNDGVDLISQTVLQMGGNRCLLYGSEGAILDKELKALNMLQNRLRDYSIALHDVTSVERSLRMEGLLASEPMEHSFVRDGSGDQEDPLNTFSRRLSVADREAGGALVDHLLKMGIPVHTDNRENRRILREAYSDRSEIGKVRFFNNDAVESYGFAYKGEIHLDMRKVNAELPLHEYAHLWCEALRRINPDNWRDVVSIMKNDAATWQFVKKSYPELSDDDDLAEEVIAHYSGKRGAEKLQKELERMTPRDANYGSRWGNIFKNVSKAIQDFWKHIGDSFNFKYDSKEDIADQILNDFSKQVNPVKKVERWLVERDKEYAAAVERGDTVKVRDMFNAAMKEHVGNGVTPFIAVDGYRGKMDRLARAVKSDGLNSVNLNAINEAADLMSPLVPDNAVLVPAPSHVGYATDMLLLANAIGMRTNSEVADVLKSAPRDSQYDHKINTSKPFTAEELGIHMEGELPEGKFPVVIDNVVNTGNTAEACVKALGGGLVLSLASAVSQERHVSSLKSASPVVYDKQGQLIPLSERFELKNKWLGRIMNYKDIEQIQSALQDQPINVISIGKRMEILTKESVRSVDNSRVGYSKMITDGKDAEGCEHLERTIFYDDRPLGDFKADVFPQGQATVSYLLDVRVHPLDMADNAWEGIDDMELDDEYDYGCIRFEDEATMIAFYESHQEEIDYRNGRYNYIEEVATTKGKIAAETLSLNIPVQYLFKPVPPMRDWVDIKTDKSFLNLPQEEQERLLYRKGESVSDYKNRNHLYWGDTDFAFYFWQKYADRQDEVKSILVDGITVDNYQEVSQKIASLVDSKDEGYAIRSLLNYNKLPDQERFYEAFEAAFEQRMINIPEYPVQKQVQGLESYTIDEIKNLVRNHIEDNYGELLMDDGFVIKEITVIGSRSRGEAHEGSDLDILLEYDGNNIREDVMFNILNFEPLEIEGIKVDINPINPHYSLTTEEWLARDARWREEDRKKAIVQPIEKENVESKNIRSMQISVIKSNLQVLADSLLPDTQSRVHFLKPQDPKLPSAVGGEIYRRDDGIHLFREKKDVPLSSIDDRDEVNDLYRSLLEYSITERIGNGNAMNFPDSPNVDGYKISVAAVVDGNLRVMGTRDGDQANNSSYITNEGLKELIGIIDKRIAEDENIYDNLSVAGSVNGQKEKRSDVLTPTEKEVIHSIIRGNGNRPDLLEGDEYDRLLHEVHETESSMMNLKPLSDRQRDILREICNSFDGGVHELAIEMNVDVEKFSAALNEKPQYQTQEDRLYSISYGDDPTGVIEGDIHVHFTKELESLSFDEFEQLAEDMGGSARLMSGERWADFYHENDAEKFAEKVVALNNEPKIENKEQNPADYKTQIMELLPNSGIDFVMNRGSELVIPFSGDKEIQISDIYCKDDIQLSGYIVDNLNQEKVPICPFEELPAPVQLSLFNEIKNTLSDIMAVSNAQEELPYRISYGDDPTGDIEGDIHVHFTKELAYVSFEDFKNFAEDLGGSVRLMNNDRWADFYRENDAVNFANTVVDVNVSRMAAAREGVKEQPKVAKLQDREAFIAEVTEKIHQTENKNYSPEDVVILKEAAIAHIEKYNSDYFQTKDVDIKGMIDGSEVTDRHSLLASVAAVVYDIHSEALGRDSGILDRLLPIDMDRADETLLQGRDASAAAEAILDLRQNNLKEVLDTKVAEVNTTLAEYNRLSQASDSNYILHSHVESYALEQQSENEFALSDPDQRKFVTSWMGVRDMLNHLAGLMQKMTAKFPELNPSHEDKVEVSSDQKNSVVGQVTTEKSDSQKKTSKWDNLDYTKYVLPEGADIKNKRWKFIKPKEDEQYGKYHIMCDFKGKHYEREMYGNDIKALFEKDEKGQRTNRVTLDQLVAKYFGKQFAEAMSIGSVQEAEHVLAEQKDAKDLTVGTKEQQAQQQADKEKVAAQQQAAEEKKAAEEVARKKAEEEQKAGKKEKVPALILQSSLLIGAFLAAKENDGVWLNKDGKAAPVLHQSGVSAVSAFNGLMMALHSDAHGYKSNDYTTFNAAKGDGYHVMGGESGLPFNWYKWDKYVNRFNANEVIDKAAYDALAPEEKELYKVQRIKEERSIFNIDQTTMPEAKKEAYGFILEAQEKDSVYRGTDESTIQPVSMQKQFVELKEKRPDAILLMRDGNCYNLYGEDADKLSGLLGLEVKDHDPEGNEIKFAAFPHHALDINLPKMIRAGHRVAICDQIGDICRSQRHDAAAAIYSKAEVLEDALVKLSGDTYKVMKEPFFDTVYDCKEDTLRFTNRRYYSPGNEIVTALQRVNDSFRAAAAYTGGESRLNRVAYSTMLPVDAEKYDRLVSELAAGVLMSRAGLPATLSKESLALVPYWERELKESPKLMESVERDVNNAVEVLEKIKAGEIVDYAAIRGDKAFDAVRPKLYTIANELATIPDAEAKVVVVVKDQQNKSAAVILPAGASLEVNNEIPGLNKNRFLIALRKQGFENVQFYNAGGALGLNQSNDFFADKTVMVAKLKQYDLNVLENIDLSEEIERSLKVDLKQVQVTFDDNMQPLLYVKPVDGESFTVYPEPSDVKLFFDNVCSPEFDTIRENLGQKYYGLVSRHPDLKTDVLMPKVTAGLDLSRISKVNITKDRYKPESTIMFATVDGKQQKPFELSKIEAQRYWLVDDKNKYKLLLAAQHFEEKLNVDSGQSEGGHGQFHNSHKDTVDSTSASSGTSYEGQEDKQLKKVGIRM